MGQLQFFNYVISAQIKSLRSLCGSLGSRVQIFLFLQRAVDYNEAQLSLSLNQTRQPLQRESMSEK